MAKPAIVVVVKVVMFVAPYYKFALTWLWRLYHVLPLNVLNMVFGAGLCFFGGTYVASIAAIEAFRQMGWGRVKEEISVVWAQAKIVGEANDADDVADLDNDGVADVDQLDPKELMQVCAQTPRTHHATTASPPPPPPARRAAQVDVADGDGEGAAEAADRGRRAVVGLPRRDGHSPDGVRAHDRPRARHRTSSGH